MMETKISNMMRLAISLIVAFCICLTAGAQNFSYNGLNYSVFSSDLKTAEVADNAHTTALSGIISIPSNVECNGVTYSVVSIAGDAFIEDSQITKIIVPETVTSIGGGSFAYCSKLETLDLGEKVSDIGADLFTGLSSLKEVICRNPTPPSVSNWGTVRTSATLYVPANSVDAYKSASIWSYFQNIKALESPLPSPLPSISTFPYVKNLNVGNNVSSIPNNAFDQCTMLNNLKLGSSLTEIGDKAFSGCTGLTEVILPPSVETIGASAFAGDTQLTSIIMGHKVTTIGEKAFDLCPAQTVSITAQTPPDAPDNTFSNYTGNLYVQGEDAADAYYDADFCWFQFEGFVMIEPTELKVDGDTKITGKPGDTFQLTAKLYPENVTLPHIFWRSTNPDIATVDHNGLVTLHANLDDVMAAAELYDDDDVSPTTSCKIIGESLYANGPRVEVEVEVGRDLSTIDEIFNNGNNGKIDYAAPVEVYNLNGVRVADSVENLANGIYIIRQGSKVEKIAIK